MRRMARRESGNWTSTKCVGSGNIETWSGACVKVQWILVMLPVMDVRCCAFVAAGDERSEIAWSPKLMFAGDVASVEGS